MTGAEQTDDESSPSPAGKRWGSWWWLFLALGLVGLIVTLQDRAKSGRAKLIESIRASGYPALLSDLDKYYPYVADGENAAMAAINAFDYHVTSDKMGLKLKLPEHDEPLSSETKRDLSLLMATNIDTFEAIREIRRRPKSHYPVDWSKGIATLLPHLAPVKSLANLLHAKAVFEIDRQQDAAAVDAILDSFAVSHSLYAEPTLIAQLVRLASVNYALLSIERYLHYRPLTRAQAKTLLAAIDAAEQDNRSDMVKGLAGERCLGISIFQSTPRQIAQILNNGGSSTPSFGPEALYTLRNLFGITGRDFVFYNDMLAQWMEISRLQPPDSILKAREVSARMKAKISWMTTLSRQLLPALERVMEKTADSDARLRLTRAAIFVEQYRALHSMLPVNLLEAAPEVSTTALVDPFDGQRLRYRKLGPPAQGYILYSVGLNQQDDNGLRGSSKASLTEFGVLGKQTSSNPPSAEDDISLIFQK